MNCENLLTTAPLNLITTKTTDIFKSWLVPWRAKSQVKQISRPLRKISLHMRRSLTIELHPGLCTLLFRHIVYDWQIFKSSGFHCGGSCWQWCQTLVSCKLARSEWQRQDVVPGPPHSRKFLEKVLSWTLASNINSLLIQRYLRVLVSRTNSKDKLFSCQINGSLEIVV